jgi:hypothetical protein
MNIVTNSAGLIVMVSDGASPTPPEGGSLYTLSNAQRMALVALAQQPNSGITFDGTTLAALPFVPPPVIDLSEADNLDKVLKAILYAAGGMAGKTPAQTRAAFKAAWQALP